MEQTNQASSLSTEQTAILLSGAGVLTGFFSRLSQPLIARISGSLRWIVAVGAVFVYYVALAQSFRDVAVVPMDHALRIGQLALYLGGFLLASSYIIPRRAWKPFGEGAAHGRIRFYRIRDGLALLCLVLSVSAASALAFDWSLRDASEWINSLEWPL